MSAEHYTGVRVPMLTSEVVALLQKHEASFDEAFAVGTMLCFYIGDRSGREEDAINHDFSVVLHAMVEAKKPRQPN